MTFCMNEFLSEFIRLLWTLIIHSPDSLSSDMVDRSQVLTRLIVLNDLSTVQVVAGRVSSVIIAWRTGGKTSIFFTKYTNSNSSWFSDWEKFPFLSCHTTTCRPARNCQSCRTGVCFRPVRCSMNAQLSLIWLDAAGITEMSFGVFVSGEPAFQRLDYRFHVRDVNGAAKVFLTGVTSICSEYSTATLPWDRYGDSDFFGCFQCRSINVLCENFSCILPMIAKHRYEFVNMLLDT